MSLPVSDLAFARSGLPAALPADLLHGLMLKPPVVRWDGARYVGSALQSARVADVGGQAGVVAVVQRVHFLGVVAVTPLYARQAAAALAPVWQDPRTAHAGYLDSASAQYRVQAQASHAQAATGVTVWSLNAYAAVWLPACPAAVQAIVRRELAVLLNQPEASIRLTVEAGGARDGGAGDVHLLDVLDAASTAALLSQEVGRPVCVACQTARADDLNLQVHALDREHRTPVSEGLLREAPAAHDAMQQASPPAHALLSDGPWAVRPGMARMLSQPGQAHAIAVATAHADFPVQARVQAHVPLHASVEQLNAVQVFSQESLWYENALARNEDPLTWRVQHLPEGRGRQLAQQVIQQSRRAAEDTRPDGSLTGTGFATAQVDDVDESGFPRTSWSAWVAEVAVDPRTGNVDITRVVAGQDSASLRPAQAAPVGPEIEHQNARLLADARRLLTGPATFDDWASPSQPAASHALSVRSQAVSTRTNDALLDPEADTNDVLKNGRLGLSGVMTLPAAAAIANAIHQATGVRLRQVPFNTEQLRVALAGRADSRTGHTLARSWKWLAAGAASIAGIATMIWPLKSALPLTDGPDVSLYSSQAIERGRLIAAAGDCIACHTVPGGAPNAGGLGLETPFGTIYTTNITPDNETGIGRWSFAAFDRAMRHGVHQDGKQLYPAFPYTAYAKLSDADMQALYGYLMSQPAVNAEPPRTQLAFPFSARPLLAGWNALFHDPKPFVADPARSPEWLRGAYLVEGVGHCSACHSPRNALGAEKKGLYHLSGGEAEGWQAPALDRLASGTNPWTGETLFQYLRTGYSVQHGVAAGPMAPVIQGLAELPDSDVRAISTYLLDLPGKGQSDRTADNAPHELAQAPMSYRAPGAVASADPATDITIRSLQGRLANGEQIYQNACVVCHDANSGPTLFGARPLLSLNTNLHAATPDNLIQVILHGIQSPAHDDLGYMPGFKDSLDDRQIADLVEYLRVRHAPDAPAWPDPTATISRLRDQAGPH